MSQSIRQACGSSSSCEKHFRLNPLQGSSSLIVMPSMDWKSPQRFDIACGNKAVLLDMPGSALRADIAKIMDGVWQTISFGVGRRNAEQVDHSLFESPAWKCEAAAPLKQMAREQLGTVGSGNHYVDLFTDEQDRVWIGVHFGSRGLGQKIAAWFLKKAGAKDVWGEEVLLWTKGFEQARCAPQVPLQRIKSHPIFLPLTREVGYRFTPSRRQWGKSGNTLSDAVHVRRH